MMTKGMFISALVLIFTAGALGAKPPTIRAPAHQHTVHVRSIDDTYEPFWPSRGKKELNAGSDDDPPFWGSRGRRDSSEEDYPDTQKSLSPPNTKISDEVYGNFKQSRDDTAIPFWAQRGRRSSEELIDTDLPDDVFWGSRGRRQEDEPFWGSRGRRQDDSPFWASRGRRDDEPFWGSRGRREESPVWGHRGRRDDDIPFWGHRGRRDEPEPFWANRGRRKESETFWNGWGRRKQDLKDSILNAINDVEKDIENLSRLRRSPYDNSFWANRSRDSKLKHLFTGTPRTKSLLPFHSVEPGTVLDSRIYAEEPHYIIVERSSRASGEVDPFFISRGKKYYIDYGMAKGPRDRRGAIEEIVKSVRNDPFYIARGKKDASVVKVGNSTMSREEFSKAKELICATVDLIKMKDKTKREVDDNERDRRTTLKKLAAQLQMDPYFVSRGKKSDEISSKQDLIIDFINEVAQRCF